MRLLVFTSVLLMGASAFAQTGVRGYYRDPVLHAETLVFVAEGDLWSVPLSGGLAHRLTTHPAEETHPIISPDGQTLAFTARYEGPNEVYTMPLTGGVPVRRTFEGEVVAATAFTPAGALVYTTLHYSTLPDPQLVSLNLGSGEWHRIALSQASEASFDASGTTLYFVRPFFHNNVTRWYTGGKARQIWKFRDGAAEAEQLTHDYAGESHTPMWWNGRVYFVTDRDGTMNLWSMDDNGGDFQQHTDHRGWDVRFASLDAGRIVYVVAADIWLYDIASHTKHLVPITLASDLDQLREHWMTKPMQSLTSAHLHPSGEAVVLTARGRVFVVPAREGRLVHVSRRAGVRYRDVVFMPDGKALLGLSDANGELEFVHLPPNGVGPERALTADGTVLRFKGAPSPDGKWVAYADNNRDAWLLNTATHASALMSTTREGVKDFAWSPDSRSVAFSQTGLNSFDQIWLCDVQTLVHTPLTSERVNSRSAAWSPDGKWIYFLSDRNLRSAIGEPWGARQPEPYVDKPDKIYQVALQKGLRSPFQPTDELTAAGQDPARLGEDEQQDAGDRNDAKPATPPKDKAAGEHKPAVPKPVTIDYDGLAQRLYEVPVPAGLYRDLAVNSTALYWAARDAGSEAKTHLMALAITSNHPKPTRLLEDIRSYELSHNGKKLLVRKADDLYVVDAGTKALTDLEKAKLNLAAWSFPIDVREDWRQIFIDAWRLERDYFYDPEMHGVDWDGVRTKYLPLVERVTTRSELSDLIGLALGELSALHTAVREGDLRHGPDDVKVATLGARLVLDRAAGGYRIEYIYRSDPDYPDERSPLADPQLGIVVGDVITMINGVEVLSVGDPNALLRNQAKQQVLLQVQSAAGTTRKAIVTPMADELSLRYSDWELTRRQRTEQLSDHTIGYVHLRAMRAADLTAWYRQFYPVFNRQGLIIDVRHNGGGNIDSFLLSRLLRKDWMYWKDRAREPYWNMQYAFRGHIVVLVDASTRSDGEAFAEGVRRLGLGKIIGVRTWGGQIWLNDRNRLSDGGIASAPMQGVYGPEGTWLIEQHGVDPDLVIDNLPHATFLGSDAQLEAAVHELLEAVKRDPRPVPAPPAYPQAGRRRATADSGPVH
jgi:tricorn protease